MRVLASSSVFFAKEEQLLVHKLRSYPIAPSGRNLGNNMQQNN